MIFYHQIKNFFKIFNLHTQRYSIKEVTLSRNEIKRKNKRNIINFDSSNPFEVRFEQSNKSEKDEY